GGAAPSIDEPACRGQRGDGAGGHGEEEPTQLTIAQGEARFDLWNVRHEARDENSVEQEAHGDGSTRLDHVPSSVAMLKLLKRLSSRKALIKPATSRSGSLLAASSRASPRVVPEKSAFRKVTTAASSGPTTPPSPPV